MAVVTRPTEPASKDVAATYDFHGLFAVRVRHPALNALMANEFSAFADGKRTPDLTVEEGEISVAGGTSGSGFFFDDRSLIIKATRGKVQFSDGRLVAEPGVPVEELLHWVEDIMSVEVPARDAVFTHAAAVARDDAAYVFPAFGQTGKTSTAISFLKAGYGYLSDDWCFLTSRGQVLAFPRWLRLYGHHFGVEPSLLRSVTRGGANRGLRRRLALAAFADSLDPSTSISERLRRWIGSRYFVHVRVPVGNAIPDCQTVLRASLAKACLLVASRSSPFSIELISPEELARRAVIHNYERMPFRMQLLAMAYARNHDQDVSGALNDRDTAILRAAFSRARCLQLSVPRRLGPSDLGRIRKLVEGA